MTQVPANEGLSMNAKQRESLRRLAGTSICGEAFAADVCRPSPVGTLTCSIELRELPVANLFGVNLLLSVSADVGNVRYFARHNGLEKNWACVCARKVILREIEHLEKYGLWELNDFLPSPLLGNTFMDGSYMIVRGCDPARDFNVDATLFTAGVAASPFLRAFDRAAERLLNLDRSHFAAPPRPWWRLFGR